MVFGGFSCFRGSTTSFDSLDDLGVKCFKS